MHTSQCICHAVGSRSCSHVVRVKGTSCTAAGCYGEVLLALLDAFFLVGTCNRVLETCRVGRVSCDGYVYAFLVHDGNAFAHIIGSIAVYFRAEPVRISNSLYFLQFSCMIVIFGLHICKSVNSGDNLCRVFSKTVQDYSQRFLTNLVGLLRNTDSAFCSCERLMSGKECEAVCVFFQKHLA